MNLNIEILVSVKGTVIIRGETFDLRTALKKAKFDWNASRKYWYRSYDVSDIGHEKFCPINHICMLVYGNEWEAGKAKVQYGVDLAAMYAATTPSPVPPKNVITPNRKAWYADDSRDALPGNNPNGS